MDAPIRNQKDGAETLHDTIPNAGEQRVRNGREIEHIVADAMAALDERSRFIITESTMHGDVSLAETGGMLGLPAWKVKAIREEAYRRLRRWMKVKAGIL